MWISVARGVDRLISLMREQENRLRMAGIAVFYLCHTKNKEKTDLKTGEKYEQITNNLQSNIYTKIADAAQMVMVGVMERDIVGGKIISEDRVVYLRGTSEVDAGSRFSDLPEKIHLSPREFLDAFEQGVKASLGGKADLSKMRKEEEKAAKKKAEVAKKKEEEAKELAVKEDKRAEYIEQITKALPGATKDQQAEFKKKIVATGCSNIKDPDMPIEVLEDIIKLIA